VQSAAEAAGRQRLTCLGALAFGFGAVAAFAVSAQRSGKAAKADASASERLPKYFDYVHELENTACQNGKTDAQDTSEQDVEAETTRLAGPAPWYDLNKSPGGEGLAAAYEQCREITERYSKTFYLATALMPKERGSAFWAVYAWCRRTDDLVDMPRKEQDNNLLEELVDWEHRLDEVFAGRPLDVIDAALTDTVIRYPTLSVEPFKDMIKGMIMDVPGTGQNRYQTWEELDLYCYRVAGTVGLMSLPIFGTAEGYTEDDAREAALSLGCALQITNILRDVGEDARRGRIYLPQEDMKRFNVTEEQILNGKVTENYKNLMRFEIDRAESYYKAAQDGIGMLSPVARFPTQAALEIYRQILIRLVANDFDNLSKRAYVSKFEKFSMLPGIWWKSQDSGAKADAGAKAALSSRQGV
jgi:phytoene synthase